MRRDRGSGSVLAVAIVAGLVAVTALAVPALGALATRQALIGAADASALAAADAAAGAVSGVPCERAEQLAGSNGARLDACEVDGYVVTVAVSVAVFGIRVSASATAGPAEATD